MWRESGHVVDRVAVIWRGGEWRVRWADPEAPDFVPLLTIRCCFVTYKFVVCCSVTYNVVVSLLTNSLYVVSLLTIHCLLCLYLRFALYAVFACRERQRQPTGDRAGSGCRGRSQRVPGRGYRPQQHCQPG
jgi:hypothetical protein